MRRIKLIIQYDGTGYQGWQIQKTGKTIQGTLEESIERLTGTRPTLTGAGRTDAGVHALGQTASFGTDTLLPSDTITRALNALLPPDIMILESKDVPDTFHARYSAIEKTYTYHIAPSRYVPVFMERYVWRSGGRLMLDKMQEAAPVLLGNHDFSAFRGSGCSAESPVRELLELSVDEIEGAEFMSFSFDGRLIRIRARARSFLRHMVRNIVGTLCEVGRGKIDAEGLREILESKDRRLAGPTAHSKGLFLESVKYPD